MPAGVPKAKLSECYFNLAGWPSSPRSATLPPLHQALQSILQLRPHFWLPAAAGDICF